MNIQALCHIPKSNYAYAYKTDELHIRLRTAKKDMSRVNIVFGYKFNWNNSLVKHAMRKLYEDEYFDYYQYELHSKDYRIGYYFELTSGEEIKYFTEAGIVMEFDHDLAHCYYFQYPYINAIDVHKIPAWTKETVFYQIFVERFFNGDVKNSPPNLCAWEEEPKSKSFFGGDLRGIIEKLDHLSELGINGIYLTPIFASPSNHKYDITDYFEVDSYFGSKETLKELVDKAHERGIRIVLDAVFNHCSDKFPPFLDVIEKGKDSRYLDWFHLHEDTISTNPLNYETFGYISSMPKLNTTNPELKQYLLDCVQYWTQEFGIDGWRLDVSDEIDHHFWREFRAVLKEVNTETIIIGENWHNALPWLMGDQFDSVMNYPVTKLCLDFFAKRQMDAISFEQQLGGYLMRYPDQVNEVMLNLLDSHDTERFLYSCEGQKERLKAAAAFLFAYKGMPCTYYGTEIGMTGEYDPGCRRGFDWSQENWDMELLQSYKKLIRVRKEEPAIHYGDISFSSTSKLFVMKRTYWDDRIIILINNSDEEQEYIFDENHISSAREILSGRVWMKEGEDLKIKVPSSHFFYIKLA
jgi:glycosidase